MTGPDYDDIFKRMVKSAYRGSMPEEKEIIRREGGEFTDDLILYASGGETPTGLSLR